VRIGLLADVHGDLDALHAALGVFDLHGVDTIMLAGDAVSSHRLSDDVLDLIREREIAYIVGNHELTLLRWSPRTRGRPDSWEHLQKIPAQILLDVGGRSLLMVHGSPWTPHDDYLHRAHPALARTPELGVDFLVLGHTHAPMRLEIGGTVVVNPGSAAEPRGEAPAPTCAILETTNGAVTFVELRE
jgi:putative phosphoesterase